MNTITPRVMSNIANLLFNGKSQKEILGIIIKDMGRQDWNKYTKEELLNIGFRKWDEESNLLLAPKMLLQVTELGMEITNICNETKEFDGFESLDIRMGVTVWGVIK